jgi:hypothetical protein
MRGSVTVARILVRVLGSALIILGLLFWTGNALALIPVHMLLGLLLVLGLWTLAILAARAGEQPGVVALAITWGFIVPLLGVTQDAILPGPAHWLIRLLHLLVGLGAMGLAETLARRSLARFPGGQPRRATQAAHGG